MAPYFKHLLNAILELKYLEALNKLSVERYQGYKEQWLPAMPFSEFFLVGENFRRWFGDGLVSVSESNQSVTEIPNVGRNFQQHQLQSIKLQIINFLKGIYFEQILSVAFGTLLLTCMYIAYSRYSMRARESAEEAKDGVHNALRDQAAPLFRSVSFFFSASFQSLFYMK